MRIIHNRAAGAGTPLELHWNYPGVVNTRRDRRHQPERHEAPGAWELREALRAGEVSSRELVQSALDAAAARAELGALVSTEAELALAEADEADRILSEARPDERVSLPPLLGLPTVHKDLVDQRGHVTTHGSRAVPHARAAADDPIVAAVRAAGAVSIGKTQVPEFGIAGYSENEVAPPARNPHDPGLTAGGSSGGTAAAIAAGIVPAAIASDAGGAIPIPPGACGLVGLKPGRGVVPVDAANGIFDEIGAPRMGVSGPVARDARDAALWYDAILHPGSHRGSHPGSDATGATTAVARAGELTGLRIGVSLASPFAGWADIVFSDDARAALDAGIAALECAGHAVDEADIRYDPRYPEAFTTVWTSGLARMPLSAEAEGRLGPLARMFLERARATSPERLGAAVEALREFAADASRQWGAYDAVLTPALASTPPRIGAFGDLGPEGDYRLQCEWAPQTSMVNVAGAPAVTAPTWWTAPTPERPAGLPMGVQVIGRAGSEFRLLQLAAQLMDRAQPRGQ